VRDDERSIEDEQVREPTERCSMARDVGVAVRRSRLLRKRDRGPVGAHGGTHIGTGLIDGPGHHDDRRNRLREG
jgi:hypothetical protein